MIEYNEIWHHLYHQNATKAKKIDTLITLKKYDYE